MVASSPSDRGERLRATLADPEVLAERAAARRAPHILPLTQWVEELRRRHDVVPDVDPFDGGIGARVLLLLETPGPGSAPLRFVSRDNPTGTAANIRRFCEAAGLARTEMVLWNTVPWLIHEPGARNRPPRRGEIAAGLANLPAFLACLPRLRVAVLAGRVAAEARPLLATTRPELLVLDMPHPSPTFVCTNPAIPMRIGAVLSEAALALSAQA